MRLWRRRDGRDARLARLEQRMDDVEDSVELTLAPDVLDDLAQRVGELSLTVPAQEDLLDLRLHTARVATDLARLAAELHATVDRLAVETGEDLATMSAQVEALRAEVVGSTAEADLPRSLRRA